MTNKYCPLCGELNDCMAGTGAQCWCDVEYFPNEIFELVPIESKRKHCICKNCLTKFREEQSIRKNSTNP